jgi:broad-specificity NMP kinase
MKDLIVINGTMGVGKTATSWQLLDLLQPCAYLDGDWCWTMKPFVVSEENKAMVTGNIIHVLRSYLANSAFQHIIFTWVLHRQEMIDDLLAACSDLAFRAHVITLECAEPELRRRLEQDVRQGLRTPDVVDRSLARTAAYAAIDSIKIDVTEADAETAAARIAELVRSRGEGC